MNHPEPYDDLVYKIELVNSSYVFEEQVTIYAKFFLIPNQII